MFKSIRKYFSIIIMISLIVPSFVLKVAAADVYHMPLIDFTSYSVNRATSGTPFTIVSPDTVNAWADIASNPTDGNKYYSMYHNKASSTLKFQYDFNTKNASGATPVFNINYVYSFKAMVKNLRSSSDYCTFVLQNNGTKPAGSSKPPAVNFLKIYGNGDMYCANDINEDGTMMKADTSFIQGIWYDFKIFFDVPNANYLIFLDDGSGLKRLTATPLPLTGKGSYNFATTYYNSVQFIMNNGSGSNINTQMAVDDLSISTPDVLSLVSSLPANNSNTAIPSKTLSLVFNNLIDVQGLTNGNIVLDKAGTQMAIDNYKFDAATKTLKIFLQDFMDVGTSYTLTLKDIPDISGAKLPETTISFSTIVPPAPVVVQTVPVNNAIDVLPSKKLSIVFNTRMNESALTSSNIKITNTSTNTPVQWGITSYSDVDYKFDVTPQAPLDLSVTYQVDITGVSDFYGNSLPDYSFSFTTSNENLTDSEVAQAVLNGISINDVNMTDTSLTLPTSGKYGTTIRWSVPTNNYITSTGMLIDQPKYADGPATVTLTATANYSGIEAIRDYFVKIKPTPNVVRNPGFESPVTGTTIPNWVGVNGTVGNALATVEPNPHNGNYSCYIPLRTAAESRMRYNFADGDLLPDKKYYVSVWAKQKEPLNTTPNNQLYYQIVGSFITNNRINLTNDWQKLSIVVNTNAVDSNGARKPLTGEIFMLMNEKNGPITYYMDDFVVQRTLPYNINVTGADEICVPEKVLTFSEQYTSKILNQFGNTDEMEGEGVTWSLPDNNTGVTIDTNGKITVNKNAIVGDVVRVRATNNTYTWLYTDHNVKLVQLEKTAPKAQNFVTTVTTTLADKSASLVGDIIKSKYEYFDINEDEEADSTYHWIGADSKDSLTGTILESGTVKAGQELSYTVKVTDINKYIKLVVTPYAAFNPKVGSPVSTDGIIVRTLPQAKNLQITGTASSGNELVGKYDYYHPNGNLEDGSIVGWYSGDNLLLTGSVYRVRGDEGTLSFKVTPRTGVEPFEGVQQSISVTVNSNTGKTTISNKGGGGGSYIPPAPTPTPVKSEEFKDISEHWAKAEIAQALEMKLVNGKDAETFAPDDNITRAEFIALIARASKFSQKEYAATFSDVNKDDWFSSYVQTALDNGIISSDSIFRPNDLITRQEMTKIIINSYLKSSGKQLQNTEQKQFEDNADIADWAIEYVNEANSLGIIKGESDGKFAPKHNATRAQSTVVILRLIKILNGGE